MESGALSEHALIVCCLEMPEIVDQLREGLFGDEIALSVFKWLQRRRENRDKTFGADETLVDLYREQYGLYLAVLQWLPLVSSPKNWPYWEDLAKERARLRHATAVADTLKDQASGGEVDLQSAMDRLRKIELACQRNTRVSMQQVTQDAISDMEARYASGKPFMGLTTGIHELDVKTDGMLEKAMWVIAARPSVGKTTLACNLAVTTAVRNKVPSVFFSLEMPALVLLQKCWHIMSGVSQQMRKRQLLNHADFAKLGAASAETIASPLVVVDNMRTIQAISSEVRRLKTEIGLKVVYVDYLQRVGIEGSKEEKWNIVARVSNVLKDIAMDNDVTVVALGQLNRDVGKEEREPTLADIRGSGEIEQDADVIAFLWQKAGELMFNVGKSRVGTVGLVPIAVDYDTGRFGSPAKVSPEDIPK